MNKLFYSVSIILIFFIFITYNSSAQKLKYLSNKEINIISSIDSSSEKYTSLLKKIVNINSGTMNFDGVKKVSDVLEKEFQALGLETTFIPGNSFGRAGHLVAQTRKKRSKRRFLLIGHLDTVFEPSSPFQSYTMENDSIMKGPGVADMKGGNVIILLVLKALKDANLLDKLAIKVVLTGDEESSGSPLLLSKKEIIDAAIWADVALGFENADGNPKTIVTSRRGSLGWELEVTGSPAHSSQIFTEKVGVGAIYEASRILNSFYTELSDIENLTFNPGVILGGTAVNYHDSINGGMANGKSNVVAQKVVVKGDLRAISIEQLTEVKNKMNKIVSDNYDGTSAKLIFEKDGGYPPLANSRFNNFLLNVYDRVSHDLGFGNVTAVNPRNAGAADISFTQGYVEMALDGLGLSGSNDHTINETGNLNMLSVQAKRAALLIHRMTRR